MNGRIIDGVVVLDMSRLLGRLVGLDYVGCEGCHAQLGELKEVATLNANTTPQSPLTLHSQMTTEPRFPLASIAIVLDHAQIPPHRRHAFFETDEKVELNVFVKNVDATQLIVKIEPRKVGCGALFPHDTSFLRHLRIPARL